jgi:VanZ family protein
MKYKNFLFYWSPILVYCTLIYIQSSNPSPEEIPSIPYFDKILHFAAYALLGALFLRAFKTLPIKDNIRLIMILSITLSSLYGISDEIHQHYVPHRDADITDALADIIGSIFGVYIYQSM